jgi:hypothetical protein
MSRIVCETRLSMCRGRRQIGNGAFEERTQTLPTHRSLVMSLPKPKGMYRWTAEGFVHAKSACSAQCQVARRLTRDAMLGGKIWIRCACI